MPQQNTSVALGFFDGVHRGHARVIREAVDRFAGETDAGES